MVEHKDWTFPGVISGNNVEYLWDEVDSKGINLIELQIIEDYCTENNCTEDEIPEDFWECLEIDEPTYLIGDWERGEDGLFDECCGENGYSAFVAYLGGAILVHVTYSKTIAHVRAMCSLCCPNQADLDSGEGDILAYTLPADLIGVKE